MIKPDIVYSVFVSSTSGDLTKYRARACAIVLTQNMRPLAMEYFPPESGSPKQVLDRYLDSADGVIIIAGARYGSLAGQLSYVEWEFEGALARGIPIVSLIMSRQERNRSWSVSEEERSRQDQFIKRLMNHSMITEFDSRSFDRVLGGALNLLPRQCRRGAGLIRVEDYNDLQDAISIETRNLKNQQVLLRLLAGIGLTYRNSQHSERGEGLTMDAANRDRLILDRLLDLLHDDFENRPVIARAMETIIRGLIDRLHGFSEPAGFIPETFSQLEAVIDELFGESLSTLKASSIHSSHEALRNYSGYWEDQELGPFFRRKNKQFLSRKGDERLLRVYVCDSVASVVGEKWFADTAIKQMRQGATVKVIGIDFEKVRSYEDFVRSYEDFGIYEHKAGKTPAGSYLLLAPWDRNQQQRGLITSVTADSSVVADYSHKFELLWAQSTEPLEKLRSERLDEAKGRPRQMYGQAKIADLFGGQVILRRMRRLDTMEELRAPSARVVRKYQEPYAKAISDHIRLRFPDARRLLYIGDTYKNDGTLVRNLQALGWDVSGFICERDLRIERLWFNSILYTNEWTDLVGFIDKVQTKVGPNTLALFDIDQTLWAPKGVHDDPLSHTRTRAISRLIDEYIADPNSDVGKRAKARVNLLYREISKVKYLPLTLDNEDFKAAICVFLSLNLVFNQPSLEGSSREAGAAVFDELGRRDASKFVNDVITQYLPDFSHPESADEENVTRFIINTFSTAETEQYEEYGKSVGIDVDKVLKDLRSIYRETVGPGPIQYYKFRAKELEEALSAASIDGDFDEQLVLNKPAWDLATWLKLRGATLLALSDRPDESTVAANGESLLDASMLIYGKDISDFLSTE